MATPPPSSDRQAWIPDLQSLQNARRSVTEAAKTTIGMTRDTDFTALAVGAAAGATIVAAHSLQSARSMIERGTTESQIQGVMAGALRSGKAAVNGAKRRARKTRRVLERVREDYLGQGAAKPHQEYGDTDIEDDWEVLEKDGYEEDSFVADEVLDDEKEDVHQIEVQSSQAYREDSSRVPETSQTTSNIPSGRDLGAYHSDFDEEQGIYASAKHHGPYQEVNTLGDSSQMNKGSHEIKLDESADHGHNTEQAVRTSTDNANTSKPEEELEDVALRTPRQPSPASDRVAEEEGWDGEIMSVFERASRTPTRKKTGEESVCEEGQGS